MTCFLLDGDNYAANSWNHDLVVVGLAVIADTSAWWFRSKGDKEPTFRTAPVKRGDLLATISATGTLEPEAAVDVGAQVAG